MSFDEIDDKLAAIMSSYWVNFATTGNPNGKDLPAWEPYQANELALELGEHVRLIPMPRQEALDFWDAYQATLRGQ